MSRAQDSGDVRCPDRDRGEAQHPPEAFSFHMSSWGLAARSSQIHAIGRPKFADSTCDLARKKHVKRSGWWRTRDILCAFNIFVSEDALIRELDLKALVAVIER